MRELRPSHDAPKAALGIKLLLFAMFFGFWSDSSLGQRQSINSGEAIDPRLSSQSTQVSSESGHAHLVAIDGYQPGKVPVVFIHGLGSDASTWKETITQLRLDPAINETCQFWTFQYSTDISYLYSAFQLRSAWNSTRVALDPLHADPALANAVLVGHSMGGLLARLQVTKSEGELWSCLPQDTIQQLKADPIMFNKMRLLLEFSPQPTIRRVVYIGTPHRGSLVTKSLVGRVANRTTKAPEHVQSNFNELRQFGVNSVLRRLPTAIDQLTPGESVLTTVADLPIATNVSSHSIIGTGYRTPPLSMGDRIVTVESARTPEVETELLVKAKHTTIHRDLETIAELKRILREHAQLVPENRK